MENIKSYGKQVRYQFLIYKALNLIVNAVTEINYTKSSKSSLYLISFQKL